MVPRLVCAQDAQVPAMQDYTAGLAPGDQIQVHFYDFPELLAGAPQPIVVRGDGMVHLPYAGSVKVGGLSPDVAEEAIEEALRNKGIVKDPSVAVVIVSSSNLSVSVTGEVKLPHAVPLYAPTPLSYVIQQAGGITSLASSHLTIIHRKDQLPTSVDFDIDHPSAEALNTLVNPGDAIEVSRQGVFFVVGEVQRPGVYPMGGGYSLGQVSSIGGMGVVKNMTMLEALTQAGGITQIAARSRTILLRTVGGKREAVTVDLVKLEKGEIADPLLHQDDVIYVPSSFIRNQTNNLFQTVVTALAAYTYLK